ncbi:MAG: ABC transporter ATP-binding protein, partial [Ruminococcus sp.]|nr:ABC transporter ATP-binding protein [Ruminococcus sp.]
MKSSAVKKLIPRLRNHMGLLILALLSAVVSISLTLLIPVLVGKAIDNIIAEGQVYFEAVTQIILYIAIAIIGVTTCQWLMNFLVNLISFRLVRDLRRDVFRKFNT